MTTKTRTKVGAPRLDPTERLRHRFYEPLLLLGMLNPRRNGAHEQPTIAFRTRNFISDWRRFLLMLLPGSEITIMVVKQ
jgi:hypothetical protein